MLHNYCASIKAPIISMETKIIIIRLSENPTLLYEIITGRNPAGLITAILLLFF